MGDVMSKMFTYAGMSTALLAVIAIHLFLWWQAIRAAIDLLRDHDQEGEK